MMLTTCPHCSLNLAVTAADLRLGQGYVRCGRCASVFNALISLTDEVDTDSAEHAAKGTTTVPALPDPAAAAPKVTEKTATPEERKAPEPPEPDEQDNQGTGTFETIILEGDSVSQTEEVVAESEVDAQLQALVERFDAVRERENPPTRDWEVIEDQAEEDSLVLDYDSSGEYPRPDIAAPPETPEKEPDLSEWSPVVQPEQTGSSRRKWWLLAACILLIVALLSQIVHHFRQQLVDVAPLRPALTGLYSLFGARLEPRWDLAAYQVRQLGAEALAGDQAQISVRASIRNAATRAQPAPLLRVVLQDRFGNRVATRDIAPQEYLQASTPRVLAADQRIDLSMLLADPGQGAVGFEIDACLKTVDGALRCASDPLSR